MLLLLVVLVPTAGMAALVAIAGTRALSERDAASRLQAAVTELGAVIDARAATADDEVAASMLVIGATSA